MSFMKEQIIKDRAYQVETTHGTEIIPFHVAGANATRAELQQYCQGDVRSFQSNPTGYVYRLSAPGYLDCTDWGYASTEGMARIHLREMYGDNEDSSDDSDE